MNKVKQGNGKGKRKEKRARRRGEKYERKGCIIQWVVVSFDPVESLPFFSFLALLFPLIARSVLRNLEALVALHI